MSKVMITEAYLEDIADAIRTKNGSSDTYKPAEMADAIEDIPGGITPSGTINITQNGTVDVTNYASASVAVPNPSTGTKQISINQNGTTTEDVTNYANAEITVAVPSNMTLIGQYTTTLSEYTSTTAETITTDIKIQETDYAWIFGTITCDSAITTSTEWGMSAFIASRYTSNGKIAGVQTVQQKGSATLSYQAMVANGAEQNYGVRVSNNEEYIKFTRQANSSGCPKLRAGNYTVKVYGLTSV